MPRVRIMAGNKKAILGEGCGFIIILCVLCTDKFIYKGVLSNSLLGSKKRTGACVFHKEKVKRQRLEFLSCPKSGF